MARTEWLSLRQAAEISGYHPDYLRDMIRQGEIKGRNLVFFWQVERSSLEAFSKQTHSHRDRRWGPKGPD